MEFLRCSTVHLRLGRFTRSLFTEPMDLICPEIEDPWSFFYIGCHKNPITLWMPSSPERTVSSILTLSSA